jgi:hypothetical protein
MGPAAAAVLCAGLFGTALVPNAKADEWNERTQVTINQPVQVPGVVLAPGSYIFQLHNDRAERQTVRVYNQDGTRLITTFNGIPVYRDNPTGHTVLRFTEPAPNQPEMLHEWFYPGQDYGLQFTYPQSRTNGD